MATGLFNWSRTAASNASATYTWAEGMAPSSVNDSARGIMSDVAQWREDISGAIVTGGSSTAYTVTSYSTFTSLALMANQLIAFTPHATNGATVTLNVDGLGAKPLRPSPGVELVAGVLILGTPYVALYNNSDAVWYLQNSFVNPYVVPIGACIDFFGTAAPNSSFVLPYGQAISRTTYSVLFAMFSTTYGVGDGSTTFNVPDLRGRVVAGKDDMGGSSANRLTDADDGLNGDTLGDTGGGETQSLVTANHAAYTPAGSVSITSINHATRFAGAGGSNDVNTLSHGLTGGTLTNPDGIAFVSGSATFTGTPEGGTSQAFGIVQPTIIANKLLRII
jgi:microcystin-dependent protein